MTDNSSRPSFRLRSSEHRILLILGDLVASIRGNGDTLATLLVPPHSGDVRNLLYLGLVHQSTLPVSI